MNEDKDSKTQKIQKDFDQQFGKGKIEVISGENSRIIKFLSDETSMDDFKIFIQPTIKVNCKLRDG